MADLKENKNDQQKKEKLLEELGFIRTKERGDICLSVVISGQLADSLSELILDAHQKWKVIEPGTKFSRSAFLKECVRFYIESMKDLAKSTHTH